MSPATAFLFWILGIWIVLMLGALVSSLALMLRDARRRRR